MVAMCRSQAENSASFISFSARWLAARIRPPTKKEARPLGGSDRHSRHSGGRWCSSAVASANTRVSMKRESIHSLSRLTKSLAASRSSPAIQMTTGKSALRRSYCALINPTRRAGMAAL